MLMETRSPPCAENRRASSAWVSMVTALTTRRPRGGSAVHAASSSPSAVAPPPTKIASRWRQIHRARPAPRPGRSSGQETPSAPTALRAIRAARSLSYSIAMALLEPSRSIHSIEIEPEPAPMSQSRSPWQGASDARVIARTSRRVICPSCSNQSSGRPATPGMMRTPGSATTSTAMLFSGSISSSANSAADVCRRRSRGPPKALAHRDNQTPHATLGEEPGQLDGRRAVP